MNAADIMLRPAKIEDAEFFADMETANHPDDAQDPVLVADYWRHPEADLVIQRFIGEKNGERVAYAHQRHPRWTGPERYGNVGGDLVPPYRTAERLDALFAAMEDLSRADGAETFTVWAWENDTPRVGAVTKRGYREERRQRFWELDLAANRKRLEAMTADAREKMRREGIAVLTIDRDDDPEKFRKVWRMTIEAVKDIPTTAPIPEQTFEDFMKWMRSPGLREDRMWVAREGDAVLGVSMLSYPPTRGVVVTDWTGVARAGRGRGVARALKCETVMQAIGLGVDRVRTDNDSRNAPILHINETMGYKRRPDQIQFMRKS